MIIGVNPSPAHGGFGSRPSWPESHDSPSEVPGPIHSSDSPLRSSMTTDAFRRADHRPVPTSADEAGASPVALRAQQCRSGRRS